MLILLILLFSINCFICNKNFYMEEMKKVKMMNFHQMEKNTPSNEFTISKLPKLGIFFKCAYKDNQTYKISKPYSYLDYTVGHRIAFNQFGTKLGKYEFCMCDMAQFKNNEDVKLSVNPENLPIDKVAKGRKFSLFYKSAKNLDKKEVIAENKEENNEENVGVKMGNCLSECQKIGLSRYFGSGAVQKRIGEIKEFYGRQQFLIYDSGEEKRVGVFDEDGTFPGIHFNFGENIENLKNAQLIVCIKAFPTNYSGKKKRLEEFKVVNLI